MRTQLETDDSQTPWAWFPQHLTFYPSFCNKGIISGSSNWALCTSFAEHSAQGGGLARHLSSHAEFWSTSVFVPFCRWYQLAISCGQNIVRSRPAVDVSWPSTSKWTAMSRWKMIMMFWNLWWRKLGKQFLEEHAWVTAEFENYVYISVLGKCQRLFSWLIHYIYILYNLFFVQISTR